MTTVDSHFSQTTMIQDLFLTTKLQPPTSMYPPVSRPRLLQRLDQGLERKLTLICAPAGSGKTTLLTDWLRSSHGQNISTAWISLDEGDNDPACFWRYVCTALERIHPAISEYLALLLQTCSPGGETMLTWLINLLGEATTPFVLVLDDYHLITAEPILYALTFFIKRMPPHMHLVLLTRFEPSLPLARLRMHGQITEIREADLRFTTEEVERFFADVIKLPFAPMHIQALTERTEGWIAGLHLAALAMRDQSDSDQFMTSFTGRSRYIVDYLMEEVIDRQSEAVQTFLLSTSILGHMCASLCASIIGPRLGQEEQSQCDLSPVDTSRSCQMMLEHLERTNLFLIPLDHQRHWYRYHHLFAEALQARLTQLHPSLVAELHMRASIWYEQQGRLSEAIEHALTAGDFPRACDLIEQVASTSMLTMIEEKGAQPDQAPAQAKPQGYMRLFADEGGPMSSLLSHIHSKDQSMQTYVQSILAACQTPTHITECSPASSSRNAQSCLQPLLDPLSGREMEVLHLVATGTPNAAIAQKLVIAPGTVKRHLSNIFSKLGAANRTQAAAQARELGIL